MNNFTNLTHKLKNPAHSALALGMAALLTSGLTACGNPEPAERAAPEFVVTTADDANEDIGKYVLPQDTEILNEPNADEIFYGKRLLNETKRLLPEHVGAKMNCNSCHISQGKIPLGDPYINSFNTYPRVMPRSESMVDLEARINGCFRRSMNGVPLDREGPEMKAMIAYMEWLSQKIPESQRVDIQNAGDVDTSLVADTDRGEKIYFAQCASCHGDNGEGKRDNLGHIVFPPLWGDESFNIGAGMARTYKAAAFVKYNMPMSVQTKGLWGHGGILSDQDAVDVAGVLCAQTSP